MKTWTQFDCSCVGRSPPALGQHQTTVVLREKDMEKGRCNMCENLSPALGSTHIHPAITKRLSNQHYQKSPLPTFANGKCPSMRVQERTSIFTLHILFERRHFVSMPISLARETADTLGAYIIIISVLSPRNNKFVRRTTSSEIMV